MRLTLSTLTSLLATTIPATAQINFQATALAPINTFAADTTTGMPMTATTLPGTLPSGFEQSSSAGTGSGSDPFFPPGVFASDATASLSYETSGEIATVQTFARVSTDQSPAFAVVGPVDIRVNVLVTPPIFAELAVDLESLVSGIDTTVIVEVDVFDDGSVDLTSGGSSNQFVVPVPDSVTSIPVRVRTFSSASLTLPPGATFQVRSASSTVNIRVRPRAACTIQEFTSDSCYIGGVIFFPIVSLDGSVSFRVINRPNFSSFLVLGTQAISSPVPLPLEFGGTCVLVPRPDIVLPFPLAPIGISEVTIPPFSAPSPAFTLYVQAVGVNPTQGILGLSRSYEFTACQ